MASALKPLVFLALCTCVAPLTAQVEPKGPPVQPPANTVENMLRRLRASGITESERIAYCHMLLLEGVAGASALLPHADAETVRLHEQARREQDRYLKECATAAARVLQRKLGRGATTTIDELRQKARSITQSEDLTKTRIQQELDPLVAELRPLVRVELEEVLVSTPALAPLRDKVDATLTELTEWQEFASQALEILASDDHTSKKAGRRPPVPSAAELRRNLRNGEHDTVLAATPMSPRDLKVLSANRELESELDPEEAAGCLLLNEIRLVLGLGALAVDTRLCNAARDHSDDMRKHGFFSHTSPLPGKTTPSDRAALAGTSGSAENIATGHGRGEGAIRAWWYSPGHHRNMLADHRRMGLGRSEQLWTQMFGK